MSWIGKFPNDDWRIKPAQLLMLLPNLSQGRWLNCSTILSFIEVELWLPLSPLFWLTHLDVMSKPVAILDLSCAMWVAVLPHQPVHQYSKGWWSLLRCVPLERGLHKWCEALAVSPQFSKPHKRFSTGLKVTSDPVLWRTLLCTQHSEFIPLTTCF